MVKRTFIGMVEAGEPLIQQAIDAMWEYREAEAASLSGEEIERLLYTDAVDALRQYHEARAANMPADEVERLRLIAESLFSGYGLPAACAWV